MGFFDDIEGIEDLAGSTADAEANGSTEIGTDVGSQVAATAEPSLFERWVDTAFVQPATAVADALTPEGTTHVPTSVAWTTTQHDDSGISITDVHSIVGLSSHTVSADDGTGGISTTSAGWIDLARDEMTRGADGEMHHDITVLPQVSDAIGAVRDLAQHTSLHFGEHHPSVTPQSVAEGLPTPVADELVIELDDPASHADAGLDGGDLFPDAPEVLPIDGGYDGTDGL